MNDKELNETINKYIRENLSPKERQRNYITQKYDELRGFLNGYCFQSGSSLASQHIILFTI